MGQSIGVENTQGLLKPGDDSILDSDLLVDNQAQAKEDETTDMQLKHLEQLAVEGSREFSTPQEGESDLEYRMSTSSGSPLYGRTLNNVDYQEYADYIDRPFSFISDDADDLRAYGQTTGEKWKYALPKFVTKVGANVIGSTAGLVYGGGAFLGGLVSPGESAVKNFWDNDFQRGLDSINEWMDEQLPHYYTKEEQEYNFWRSMGTPNFWSNDVMNGLSFVTGAVLSEYLSAGLASTNLASKTKQLFTKAGKHAGAKTSNKTAQQLFKDKVVNPHRLRNGLTTLRQLGTGAMYEAGVESRHHYDATLKNLVERFKEDHGGLEPNKDQMAGLVDIATKSANSVFAGNVALVGYSNYMMFPTLFGKGFNSTRNFKNKIASDITEKGRAYRELFKDIGSKESMARNAFRVLKTPLYEGFVEEGGQKLLDLSGQTAALNYYQAKKDGQSMWMAAELIDSFDDRFADTYGSKEGQKEIGIGFILGALGIPTKGKTGKKDKEGKDIKKWQMNGSWAAVRKGREYKKAITRLKERLEKDPTALAAFERNFDTLVRAKVIQDSKDFADVIDSPWMFKNAENDAIYNYISSRLEAGMEDEIYDNIDMVRNMSNDEFRNTFLYNEKNDLTDTQLETRKNEIADALVKRTETIKNTRNMVDKSFTNYGSEQKNAIVHAMAVSEDADMREESIIKSIEAITGVTIEGTEYEDREKAAKEEIAASKERQKNVTERLPAKFKKSEENSPEGKKVKRKLGIKEFTDPTHFEELYNVLLQKRADLQAKIEKLHAREDLSPKEKDKKLFELGTQAKAVTDRIEHISRNINKALDPDLSAMEQQYVDEWAKNDPSSYTKNSEDVIQMLKDARKIRARRHRALNMYNQLLDLKEDLIWKPSLRKPFHFEGGENIAPPEMMIQRLMDYNAEQGDVSLTDKDLERLYRRHKGSVVEFEVEVDGKVHKVRYVVQDTKIESGEDQVLIPIPSLEVLKLLRKQEELTDELEIHNEQDLKAEALSTKKRLEAVEKELAELGHGAELKKKELNFLLEAKNGYINTITGNDIITEFVQASLDYVAEETSQNLAELKEEMDSAQKTLEKAVSDLQQFIDSNIKSAADIALAKKAHTGNLAKLERNVSKAKRKLDEYESSVSRVEEDLKLLHGLKEDSNNIKNEQDATDLMSGIFKKQWGGEYSTVLSNIFHSLEESTLKNLLHSGKPEYSLAQFRELPQNQDLLELPGKEQASQLRTRWREYNAQTKEKNLVDFLNSTQDKAIKLLASVNTDAQALVERLEDLDKNIAALANLYKITEEGWDKSNKDIPGSEQGKEEFIDLISERTNISNQLNAMATQLKQSAQFTLGVIRSHEQLQNDVQQHFVFLQTKLNELLSPSFKEDDTDDAYSTQSAEASVEDVANSNSTSKGMYLNSSPITILEMMKTTGAHDQALREYEEMNDLLAKKKKVDPVRYAHVESQLRLFQFLPKLYHSDKGTSDFKHNLNNYRFMLANKNIVPKDLQDKVTFYDPTTKSFKYASDMQGPILTEDKEVIKLILTDKEGKPVLVDGQPIYSDLPSSELTKKVKDANGKEVEVYRYGKLDLQPDSIVEIMLKNGKKGITGKLTNDAQEIHKDHIKFREDILQLTQPKLIKPAGVSFTLLYRPKNNPAPTRASLSIVDNKHQVKDTPLKVSLNGKVNISKKDFKVKKGFAYTTKAGKLIPIRMNKLTGAALENVLNLFKLLAVRHAQVKNKEMTYTESQKLQEGSDKTIMMALKDMIYMGKHSFNNAPIHKKLNVKGNKIYFGESVIEMHQLLTPEDNVELNQQFVNFLKGLHHQVNYFSLKKDITKRGGLYKQHMKNVNAWTTRKQNAQKRKKTYNEKYPTYPSAAYDPFYEFKVDNDMNVTTTKWENYTEYLLGDGNAAVPRALDQIPGYSNLVETSNELDAPQFLNSFVTLEKTRDLSKLDDVGTSSAKEALKKKKEEAPVTKSLKQAMGREQAETVPGQQNQGQQGQGAQQGQPGPESQQGKPDDVKYTSEEETKRLINELKAQEEGKTKGKVKERKPKPTGNEHKGSTNKKDDC